MAGATGLEPAASGVTGRPFSNEINGPLDKIRTITCDKRAKSLRSKQTRAINVGRGKGEKATARNPE